MIFLGLIVFSLQNKSCFPLQLREITVSKEIFYIWTPSDLSSPTDLSFMQPGRVLRGTAGVGGRRWAQAH